MTKTIQDSFCGNVEIITTNKNHPKGIKIFMNAISN